MMPSDDLPDDLHRQARQQVALAVIADVPPVAAMHLDLAVFSEERARAAEEVGATVGVRNSPSLSVG